MTVGKLMSTQEMNDTESLNNSIVIDASIATYLFRHEIMRVVLLFVKLTSNFGNGWGIIHLETQHI